MSFYDVVEKYSHFDVNPFLNEISEKDVERALKKDKPGVRDFLTLLSPKADSFLEVMAKKAREKTIQYFGRTVRLYAPIYVSNFCVNECVYCGFNHHNAIKRKKLTLNEVEEEAKKLAKTRIKHVLLLTGEAKEVTPMEYLQGCVEILKKYFSSVSIEVFPMETEEYRLLKEIGVDGLTVYQETYDREVYKKVHPRGPKSNYRFRLETPERGGEAGFRYLSIGPLYGLSDKYQEAFMAALHADYLEKKYLECEINLSLPRINDAAGHFRPDSPLEDVDFVKFMLAFRLFLPRVGINMSTRERAEFRDHLVPLGVTMFSAGSKTEVGGYSNEDKSNPQFEISDGRSVVEIVDRIKGLGYQPVFKDWELLA